MSSYTKFTLATFKARLTGGSYANLTGANRAIGKTQELSEEDKGKARTMAAKHFGVAAPAKKAAPKAAAKPAVKPAKKVAKKATKKATPKAKPAAPPAKKAAKKAVKKSAKKVAKKATKSAPAAEPAPGASPKAPAMAAPKAPASIAVTTELPEVRKARVIEQMGSVVTTIGQALTSMRDAKQLFPKAELEEGVTTAVFSMSRAVQRLDQEVISPGLLPASAPAAKQTAKAGKRLKTDTAAPEVDVAAGSDAAPSADIDGLQDGSKPVRRPARVASQPT
jgi:hypothetical protein